MVAVLGMHKYQGKKNESFWQITASCQSESMCVYHTYTHTHTHTQTHTHTHTHSHTHAHTHTHTLTHTHTHTRTHTGDLGQTDPCVMKWSERCARRPGARSAETLRRVWCIPGKRVFITYVKGTFFGMSESEEASKRRCDAYIHTDSFAFEVQVHGIQIH